MTSAFMPALQPIANHTFRLEPGPERCPGAPRTEAAYASESSSDLGVNGKMMAATSSAEISGK